MSSIHTLVPDVYQLLKEKEWYNEDIASYFQSTIDKSLKSQWRKRDLESSLRLSRMGDFCPRALWYSIHKPGKAEPLPPWALFTYTYGHIIEALALTLAKAAGHIVEGEQDELVLLGIKGHRDAIIDGCVVDVKSTTSFTLAKAKKRIFEENDSFGYLDQLDGYVSASANDPLVLEKNKGYLWFIDKQLGHMHVYQHQVRPERILRRIEQSKKIVELSSPPACECGTRPRGTSGNIELDVRASYSPFKFCCFPNLRTFLYADGPAYFTSITRVPDVPEINREGKIIYR